MTRVAPRGEVPPSLGHQHSDLFIQRSRRGIRYCVIRLQLVRSSFHELRITPALSGGTLWQSQQSRKGASGATRQCRGAAGTTGITLRCQAHCLCLFVDGSPDRPTSFGMGPARICSSSHIFPGTTPTERGLHGKALRLSRPTQAICPASIKRWHCSRPLTVQRLQGRGC